MYPSKVNDRSVLSACKTRNPHPGVR